MRCSVEFRDLKAQYRALEPEIVEASLGVLGSGCFIGGPEGAELATPLARRPSAPGTAYPAPTVFSTVSVDKIGVMISTK